MRLIVENMLVNFAASTLQATLSYLTRRLSLVWQRRLTDKIARSYFSSLTYYRLAFVDKRISDPEQIFTNDIPALMEGFSDITADTLRCIFDGIYFTWRVFKEIGFTFGSLSWTYIIIAFIATKSIVPPFGKLMVCRRAADPITHDASRAPCMARRASIAASSPTCPSTPVRRAQMSTLG